MSKEQNFEYLKESDLKPVKQKRIEVSLNNLDGKDWFITIGLQYDKTYACHPYKHVITIGFVFFCIYIRF